MTIKINERERGLLHKDGNYAGHLMPGKHSSLRYLGQRLSRYDLDEEFAPPGGLNHYLKDAKLAAELEVVDVQDNERALLFRDKHFKAVLEPGKHAFWKGPDAIEFKKIDLSQPEVPADFDAALVTHALLAPLRLTHDVLAHETGLLFFNGKFQRVLEPGKYHFWNGPTAVLVLKYDTRQQQLEMAGQEIMTRDRITLRLNFFCHYRITDARRLHETIKDYAQHLYIVLQLILREYVGNLKLDELLERKDEIETHALARLREKSAGWGLEFLAAGIKDVILPGEIKTILQQVIEAEKKAQANIITRREETASTRSLLNTAKLMEENPLLLRLKEMEYIEQITSRIDRLSLGQSEPLIEQLTKLFQARE